jgi:hypothetical protein
MEYNFISLCPPSRDPSSIREEVDGTIVAGGTLNRKSFGND